VPNFLLLTFCSQLLRACGIGTHCHQNRTDAKVKGIGGVTLFPFLKLLQWEHFENITEPVVQYIKKQEKYKAENKNLQTKKRHTSGTRNRINPFIKFCILIDIRVECSTRGH
jgi:hypothetical protein